MMRSWRMRAGALRALAAAALLTGCADSGDGASDDTAVEVRMISRYDSRFAIGSLPATPYDARGQESRGELLAVSGGVAEVRFPADGAIGPFPRAALRVAGKRFAADIRPGEMTGWIDFCTGAVTLETEAAITPVGSGAPGPLRAAVSLTTGSAGPANGTPLDPKGDLRLVAAIDLPATGEDAVDGALGLPATAAVELQTHLHFSPRRPECPSGGYDGPNRVYMDTGKDGVLSMSFAGVFVRFPYDGKGSAGNGTYAIDDRGLVHVEFSDFVVPPLAFIPGTDAIRVEIHTNSLKGTYDPCTGIAAFDFDARFVPSMGTTPMTAIEVVTTITTETSTGLTHTRKGTRIDAWGDALLVGVAAVPKSGDAVIDGFLSLPSDAVCELPIHIDFVGDPPRCP